MPLLLIAFGGGTQHQGPREPASASGFQELVAVYSGLVVACVSTLEPQAHRVHETDLEMWAPAVEFRTFSLAANLAHVPDFGEF